MAKARKLGCIQQVCLELLEDNNGIIENYGSWAFDHLMNSCGKLSEMPLKQRTRPYKFPSAWNGLERRGLVKIHRDWLGFILRIERIKEGES